MVLDGMVDFAIAPFGITKERMNEVEYLITGKGLKGRIYIRNPKDGVDWELYIKPLKTRSWIGIIIFCVIVSIPMMVVKLGGRC